MCVNVCLFSLLTPKINTFDESESWHKLFVCCFVELVVGWCVCVQCFVQAGKHWSDARRVTQVKKNKQHISHGIGAANQRYIGMSIRGSQCTIARRTK